MNKDRTSEIIAMAALCLAMLALFFALIFRRDAIKRLDRLQAWFALHDSIDGPHHEHEFEVETDGTRVTVERRVR